MKSINVNIFVSKEIINLIENIIMLFTLRDIKMEYCNMLINRDTDAIKKIHVNDLLCISLISLFY